MIDWIKNSATLALARVDSITHNGGEDHHGDGRQREAQQLAVAEMVGEGDGGHGGFK